MDAGTARTGSDMLFLCAENARFTISTVSFFLPSRRALKKEEFATLAQVCHLVDPMGDCREFGGRRPRTPVIEVTPPAGSGSQIGRAHV